MRKIKLAACLCVVVVTPVMGDILQPSNNQIIEEIDRYQMMAQLEKVRSDYLNSRKKNLKTENDIKLIQGLINRPPAAPILRPPKPKPQPVKLNKTSKPVGEPVGGKDISKDRMVEPQNTVKHSPDVSILPFRLARILTEKGKLKAWAVDSIGREIVLYPGKKVQGWRVARIDANGVSFVKGKERYRLGFLPPPSKKTKHQPVSFRPVPQSFVNGGDSRTIRSLIPPQ